MISLEDLAVRLATCPRCEARPGQKCVTVTGARSARAHSPRTRAAYEAWNVGYGEGLEEAVAAVERLATANVDATAAAAATLLRRRLR